MALYYHQKLVPTSRSDVCDVAYCTASGLFSALTCCGVYVMLEAHGVQGGINAHPVRGLFGAIALQQDNKCNLIRLQEVTCRLRHRNAEYYEATTSA